MYTGFWLENLKELKDLEDLGMDGDNIRMDLWKYDASVRTGWIWHRKGTSVGCCEHNNELSGSIKRGKYVDYLRNS